MMTVIKVGGSLYDMPNLASQLRDIIAGLESKQIALFPGGGATVDAVRQLDAAHGLGEEASHWLALRASTVNAHFLQKLLPEFVITIRPQVNGKTIIDPYAFALADESNSDHLPHVWCVTSDSLAARAAHLLGADLLLLKSVAMTSGLTCQNDADAGIVDLHLPQLISACPQLRVKLVNLRK